MIVMIAVLVISVALVVLVVAVIITNSGHHEESSSDTFGRRMMPKASTLDFHTCFRLPEKTRVFETRLSPVSNQSAHFWLSASKATFTFT